MCYRLQWSNQPLAHWHNHHAYVPVEYVTLFRLHCSNCKMWGVSNKWWWWMWTVAACQCTHGACWLAGLRVGGHLAVSSSNELGRLLHWLLNDGTCIIIIIIIIICFSWEWKGLSVNLRFFDQLSVNFSFFNPPPQRHTFCWFHFITLKSDLASDLTQVTSCWQWYLMRPNAPRWDRMVNHRGRGRNFGLEVEAEFRRQRRGQWY